MRFLRRPLLAASLVCGAVTLPAQDAPGTRRTPLSVGVVGSTFRYDRNAGPGFGGTQDPLAGSVGVALGWGGTPRWMDIESRLTVSQVLQGPRTIGLVPTAFAFAPVFGTTRAPWVYHLEHQISVIAPGRGVRPFAGALIGNRFLRGSTSEQGVMNSFSLGFGLGARIKRRDGRGVGLGYRVRDSYAHPGFTRELTFDVRVPIR
jgi:hypothetical protein